MISSRINLNKLQADCLGDRDCLREMVLVFNSNMTEFLQEASVSLKARDRFGLARATGKIRMGLQLIEANTLLDYLDIIELECQHPDTMSFLEKLLEDFQIEYRELDLELNKVLQRSND